MRTAKLVAAKAPKAMCSETLSRGVTSAQKASAMASSAAGNG